MRDALLNKMEPRLEQLFALSRKRKQLLQIITDGCAVTLALLFAYALDRADVGAAFLLELAILLCVVLGAMGTLGAYREMVRYLHLGLSVRSTVSILLGTAVLAILHQSLQDGLQTRSLIDFGLMLAILMALPRDVLRRTYELCQLSRRAKLVIYGAGTAGRQLAMALTKDPNFKVIAFVDDNPGLHGSSMLNLPVNGPEKLTDWVKAGVRNVALAAPGASLSQRRSIIHSLEPLDLTVHTMPSLADLVSGKQKVGQLRHIDVEDLLGRDPVPPQPQLFERDIAERVVLVTGAGGSIGSELCRQILRANVSVLLLLEHCEHSLYQIEKELRELAGRGDRTPQIIPLLGSVLDKARVAGIMARYAPETVYHAAAYKHVPLVEANAIAGIRNNVVGTWIVANAAANAGVQSFVLVSTDKAVRPTNVMGASKRLCELGVQALAQTHCQTRMSIVRFGNVLGSSGSVVPLFRRQLEAGGPLTVTHENVIRYFMTIPEAAQLVIQAGAMGEHGDVFVLDMGEPVNIYNLALSMIRLAGLKARTPQTPEGEIEIRITGLRPGEKLYEELLISENVQKTGHPRIARCSEPALSETEFRQVLQEFESAASTADMPAIVRLLYQAPLEYQPSSETAQDHAFSATPPDDNVIRANFNAAEHKRQIA